MKEMMEKMKAGKLKKEVFAKFIQDMFNLENEKVDMFVEFLQQGMGLEFAGKTEGEKLVEIAEAYKLIKPNKIPLSEIENRYLVLDNMLDTDQMNPIERQYYKKMIDKITHIKEVEDFDNVERVKRIVSQDSLPEKYDVMNNTILHKKEAIEKYIQKFNKVNNVSFSTEFYENNRIVEYRLQTCFISKNINLAKDLRDKCDKYDKMNIKDWLLIDEIPANKDDLKQKLINYTYMDDVNDMLKFNDKINIINVRSKYTFKFDGKMMDKLKTDHGVVYMVKFVIGDIDISSIERDIREMGMKTVSTKQETMNKKIEEILEIFQDLNKDKENV